MRSKLVHPLHSQLSSPTTHFRWKERSMEACEPTQHSTMLRPSRNLNDLLPPGFRHHAFHQDHEIMGCVQVIQAWDAYASNSQCFTVLSEKGGLIVITLVHTRGLKFIFLRSILRQTLPAFRVELENHMECAVQAIGHEARHHCTRKAHDLLGSDFVPILQTSSKTGSQNCLHRWAGHGAPGGRCDSLKPMPADALCSHP
mmetsp:Transcript_34464/g.89814  ORF Transcript_34464/g.89814 Transcript_34464/m.89814 type:complete len:200 (+) Transcript_34464:740-1339(+)